MGLLFIRLGFAADALAVLNTEIKGRWVSDRMS
jgi:hypothetical protein